MKRSTSFISRQLGQGMTEYIIIVALIAIAAIGAFSFFGETIRNQVAGMSQELAGQSGDAQVSAAQAAAGKAVAQGDEKGLDSYTDNGR